MIGHFPEGEQMVALLAESRSRGLDFTTAWSAAFMRVRRGRLDSNPRWHDTRIGLMHAYAAFQRAYDGDPPTREDQVARGLLDAMVNMYDHSTDAELTELMEAA